MQAVPSRYPANHGTAADLILGEKSAIAKTTVPPHRLFGGLPLFDNMAKERQSARLMAKERQARYLLSGNIPGMSNAEACGLPAQFESTAFFILCSGLLDLFVER